ncbi:acid-sensing ion channel 1C-like, partial [Saccoglossus kowalevskii]
MDVSDNGYGFTSTDLGRNHNLYAASLSGNLASNPTETMTDDSDEKSTGCLRWKLWATEVSDIHGVKHTSGDGSRLRRFLWTLFVLASFGVLVYQCTQAIQNFIEHHHITKLDVTFKELMPFPTVTICNFNKYRRSAVTPSDMVHVGEALGLVDEERNLLYPELFSEEFIYKYKRLNYDMELKKQFNFTEFTLRTSNQKKDTIIE